MEEFRVFPNENADCPPDVEAAGAGVPETLQIFENAQKIWQILLYETSRRFNLAGTLLKGRYRFATQIPKYCTKIT